MYFFFIITCYITVLHLCPIKNVQNNHKLNEDCKMGN